MLTGRSPRKVTAEADRRERQPLSLVNVPETTSHFAASGGPVSRVGLGRRSGWNGVACVVVGMRETAGRFLLARLTGPLPNRRQLSPRGFLAHAAQRQRWAEGERAWPRPGAAGSQEGSRLTHRFSAAGPFPPCVS